MAESYREASFRGATFGVSAGEKEAGRRTVIHEFPQRDDIYAEDLGKAPSRFTVTAFCVGKEWKEQRDALEKALEEPGAGTLVHPWYGELQVEQYAPYKTAHLATDRLMAVVTMSFCLAGEKKSPSARVDTPTHAYSLSGLAGLAACVGLDDVVSLVTESAFVVQETYTAIVTAFESLRQAFGGTSDSVASLLGADDGYGLAAASASYGQNPLGQNVSGQNVSGQNLSGQNVSGQALSSQTGAGLGHTLWSALGALSVQGTRALGGAQAGLGLLRGASAISSAPPSSGLLAGEMGTMRTRVAEHTAAVGAFMRQVAVVEAARAFVSASPESRNEARTMRAAFMASVEEVLMEASASDAVYTAFTDVRAATLAAIAHKAKSAPQVAVVSEQAVLPSLVVCYRKTAGIVLEPDLVRRNAIIHPGFVPPKNLEVLLYA